MAELSRRTLTLGAAAGMALVGPGQASPRAAQPGYELLSNAIGEDVVGLARDPVAAIGRVRDHLRRAADAGLFDVWRGQEIVENDKLSLLGDRAGTGRWKVQLFRMAEGRSHPPHCHENLASCLMVLDGRLHVREYERLREQESDQAAVLRLAFDEALGPDDAILTAENHRNAHWFGAVGGSALAINFKASGFFRREPLRLRNRRYLDPARATKGAFRAPFISGAEAKARFGQRMI